MWILSLSSVTISNNMTIRRLGCFIAVFVTTLYAVGCVVDTKNCVSPSAVEQEGVPHEVLDEARTYNGGAVYAQLDEMGVSLSQKIVNSKYVTRISKNNNIYEITEYPYVVSHIDSN